MNHDKIEKQKKKISHPQKSHLEKMIAKPPVASKSRMERNDHGMDFLMRKSSVKANHKHLKDSCDDYSALSQKEKTSSVVKKRPSSANIAKKEGYNTFVEPLEPVNIPEVDQQDERLDTFSNEDRDSLDKNLPPIYSTVTNDEEKLESMGTEVIHVTQDLRPKLEPH